MDLVVVDDFYKNPDAVRELALSAQFDDVTQLNYPGFQSKNTFSSTAIIKNFEAYLNLKLEVDPKKLTFGKFRIMLAETGSVLKVHLDGHSDWTGVLYLNLPAECKGGTAFYQHKETGLHGPVAADELQQFGYSNWADLEKGIIAKDTLNPSSWIQTDFVAMKYNRLVLFRGANLFHCHTESFGTNKENGRLTQNFFFNEVRNALT